VCTVNSTPFHPNECLAENKPFSLASPLICCLFILTVDPAQSKTKDPQPPPKNGYLKEPPLDPGMTRLLLTAVLTAYLAWVGCVLGAGTQASPDLDNEARLLVQKQLLNKYVVETMDVVIKYNVFNIGGITATNVLLKDPSIGPGDFEVLGESEVSLGRIPPHGNASHTIVIRPQKFGYFNFTSAVVTFSSGENTQEVNTVYSSEPGEAYIAPFREFDKRFSPHFLDWAAFAIMSVPPLLIPLMLWHSSKSKYETVLAAKKAK